MKFENWLVFLFVAPIAISLFALFAYMIPMMLIEILSGVDLHRELVQPFLEELIRGYL